MAAATISKPIVNLDDQDLDLIVLDETGSENEEESSPTESIEDGIIVIADQSSEEDVKIETLSELQPTNHQCKCVECGYKKQLDNLQKEVVILKTKLQLLESQKSTDEVATEEEVPIVKLLFANEDFARKYKRQAEDFIRIISKDHQDSPPKSKNVPSVSNRNVSEKTEFPEGFIDNMGIASSTSAIEKPEAELPTYSKDFKDALNDKMSQNVDCDTKSNSNKKACFYCQCEDHIKSQCPKLKDKDINSHQRKFKRSMSNATQHRYHNVTDSPSKYTHYQPGKISNALRTALGLGKNDLPQHIHEMRKWGYPPGWLEDARQQSSGLTMYNSEDKDGENSPEQVKFDVNKIIEYPGFNVNAPGETRNHNHQMPMHRCNIKNNFIKHLKNIMLTGPENCNKRKSEPFVGTAKRAKVVHGEADMEIDDDDVVAIDDEVEDGEVLETATSGSSPCEPELPSQYYQNSCQSSASETVVTMPSTNQSVSPSLEDLETKKQQLMLLLDDNAGGSSSSVEGTPTRTPSTASRSRSVLPGTPVFNGQSTFKVLPDVSKFSEGISGYAPFENLPNTTGQYDRIRRALKGIRGVKEL